MLDYVLALIPWTIAMQIAVVVGVMLSIFRVSTAEKLERIVDCDHGCWGFIRRISHFAVAFAMLGCLFYGYDLGWQPWPPFVAVILAVDLNLLSGIAIMRQDIRRHLRSHLAQASMMKRAA